MGNSHSTVYYLINLDNTVKSFKSNDRELFEQFNNTKKDSILNDIQKVATDSILGKTIA